MIKQKNLMAPLLDGFQLPQGYRATKRKQINFYQWSTSEGRKAESTLKPRNGFELWTPGLGIQRLNH